MSSWDELLTQAKAEGFASVLLPKGSYEAKATKAMWKKGSNGKDQISVKYQVTEGPNEGDSVWDNMYLTLDNPKAMAVFFSKLRALGVGDAELAKVAAQFGPPGEQSLKAIAGLIEGVEVTIAVDVDEYKGKVKNKVFPQEPVVESSESEVPETVVDDEPVSRENIYNSGVNPQQPI